ncbi:MAG: argininosuccinate lyase [Anaerolineae bacterium]
MAKLWGGRFEKEIDAQLEVFNASIGFDRRLGEVDIIGSVAYVEALERVGVLTADERAALVDGLEQVLAEFRTGTFAFQPTDEDIHTAVERRLYELKGEVAGKLHTGRSRNDQVATDVRLYVLQKVPALRELLHHLQAALVDRAESHIDVIMPGYTHLQPAQPILFSHWLMSFFWMLERDAARLDDLEHRVSVLPLGSAALAGNTFGLDRSALAEALGFEAVSQNSLDAVADRDFIVEFLFWAALLQTHLSRLAEDLIIYASAEFGFVELDDAFSTGSSIMPQKKNPDALELARGKTGRMVGNLVGVLTMLKGLPSAYDKDLQEDKEPLFDAVDTLEVELPVLAGVVETLQLNPERMASALRDGLLATDLADYLVQRGVPFRESHRLVGQVVRAALAQRCGISELSLETYAEISPHFDAAFGRDAKEIFDLRKAVERRDVVGGTATGSVRAQIREARALLASKRCLHCR